MKYTMTEMGQQLARGVWLLPVLGLSACGGSSSDQSSVSIKAAQSSGTTTQVVQRAQLLPGQKLPTPAPNSSGVALTATPSGVIDTTNPFFRAMGNGRSCASCHSEANGWSMTPDSLKARFNSTSGSDPVFQTVDGSNSPNAAVGTLAQKQAAYSMLLNHGTIRVGLPIPANAEFTLAKVDDPYGFASAAQLSLFRRPLPTTNLSLQASVMWDGRETLSDPNSTLCVATPLPRQCFASRTTNLSHQANDAVLTHAQFAQGLSAADQIAIVNFETSLFTAQISDTQAGSLSDAGATGGVQSLMSTNFYFGINDFASGDYQTHAPFQRNVFTQYNAWTNLGAPPPVRPGQPAPPPTNQNAVRASIARGQSIFNTRPFTVSGIRGFNDVLGQTAVRATCASCHDAPGVGGLSVVRFINTGIAGGGRRTPDMPLYTLRNNATGETIDTTDPGRALITGKWNDIGRFKVPSLRALESRSPYFHDGSGTDLQHVIGFYNNRFQIGLSPQERNDLEAFLRTL